LICEQKYFTFPSKPDFATQEYGPAPKKQSAQEEEDEIDDDFEDVDDLEEENDFNKYYEYTFDDEEDSYSVLSELMDLMGLSNGPLSGKKLRYFKAKITRNPAILSMISMECVMYHLFDGSNTRPGETRDALCTLLHHAVAGSARDASLVEWLIQHGALTNQVTQLCRRGLDDGGMPARQMLPNTMAVHSAAIAGHENMVRILLEADNMMDLNTPTLYSKETLAHLAVKYGHRSLFSMLRSFGADICLRDGNGKRVSDVTTDLGWGREIAAAIAEIEQGRARTDRAKNRDALFRQQSLLRAERMRKSIAAQCDEERRLEFSDATAGNGAAKKKKSRKNRKKKTSKAKDATKVSAGETTVATGEEVSSELKDLLLSGDSVADHTITCDRTSSLKASSLPRIEKAAAAFVRLKNPDIPVDDKAVDVRYVLEEAEVLKSLVEVYSHPNRVNTTARRTRVSVASDAARIIHMMEKFDRVDHAAISVPALSSVHELCETRSRDFIRFVCGTAKILVSIDRKPQAGEVFDVLEKRLLKTSVEERRLLDFQKLVRAYSAARIDVGLERASSASILRTLNSM
jgi:hypothetical protein